MSRVAYVLIALLILLTSVVVSCAPPAAPVSDVYKDPIKTNAGLVSGATAGAKQDIHVYKGIPFAAPPVGNLRWKPPQPVTPWEGVKECTEFGAAPNGWSALGKPPKVSEDCLYLNVWTPVTKVGEKLPVVVWIYGGGFRFGYGTTPLYDGTNLAGKGVVVVTFNYRTGAFGFLSHPLLSKESEHGVSGNYGILDQIAALQWVQNNISAFGGDPNNVTVFGQSAGAISIVTLMASPLAKGLFQRAISHSYADLDFFMDLKAAKYGNGTAEAQGERLAKELGCDTAADPLACLRAKPADEIMTKAAPPGDYWSPGYKYGPVVDGWVLTDHPFNLFLAGKQMNVPLLIGTTADEYSLFQISIIPDVSTYQALMNTLFGDKAKQILAANPAKDDASAKTAQKNVMTLYSFYCPAKEIANSMSNVKSPVYLYQFTRVPHGAKRWGAYHALDIGYVFGNLIPILPTPEPELYFDDTDRALSETMMGYWTSFAATGNPNHQGALEWPAYSAKTNQYMALGNNVEVKPCIDNDITAIFLNTAKEKRSK
ncbi:MAG: carboxylesterase family protein [Chloroflexi bacterium]|nr:carboxylesterase family protein [Chloroflexota bacterium]